MTFSPTSAEPLRSAALKTSARASAMFTSFDEKLRRPRKLRLRVVLPPLPLPASLSRSELRTEKESPGLKLSGLTAVNSSACLPSEIRRSANIDGRCVAALNARSHARFAGLGSAEPCALHAEWRQLLTHALRGADGVDAVLMLRLAPTVAAHAPLMSEADERAFAAAIRASAADVADQSAPTAEAWAARNAGGLVEASET